MALIVANYADAGPTLAAEKPAEHSGLKLRVEALRQWMLAGGIWKGSKRRDVRVSQPRLACLWRNERRCQHLRTILGVERAGYIGSSPSS